MKAHEGEALLGPAGTAIEIIFDKVDTIYAEAGVAAWLLHCPGQSAAWEYYCLSIVHLRPIKGKKATKEFKKATHEIILYAISPDIIPCVANLPWIWLTPFNVVEQVELPDDESAKILAKLCVQAVLVNALPAEPMLAGAKEPWHTSLIKTSAHLRGEAHAS